MAGHLFIVRGDLTRLHCDAWLLPCGVALDVVPDWLEHAPDVEPPIPPPGWRDRVVRTFPWHGWPEDAPTPWLTNVGSKGRPVEWYVAGAREFVLTATHRLEGQTPRAGRSRHLLGLPLVGTRMGGAFLQRGTVAAALLPVLLKELETLHADVVLVLNNPEALAACQQVRATLTDWPELSPAELRAADRLAEHARDSHLALFLGAGVSAGAGLPNWNQLLMTLAEEAGYEAPLREALSRMNLLDQAEVLARRLGDTLRQRVVEALRGRYCSLAHALLAGLPCREAVTQNYDQLFELALEAAGDPPSVLPYKPEPKKRWLLKMHGCLSHPEDIVLRRQDYLRYLARRGALAGLVQGLLLTRHLLFVGFSLSDDNFLSIVDDVRRARGPAQGARQEKFGTALFLHLPEPFRELWDEDMEFVSVDDPRRLEIFLDRVSAGAVDASRHLLDETFKSLLNDDEIWLKRKLLQLQDEAPDGLRSSSAWEAVGRLMRALGQESEVG